MSTSTPAEFHRSLLDLTLLAGYLEEEYRWVHTSAHARTVTDEAKVQTGGPSDGTSGIVTSTEKARQRRNLVHVHERVKDAMADLRRAQSLLIHAEERTPERVRFEQLRNPRSVTLRGQDGSVRPDAGTALGVLTARQTLDPRGEGVMVKNVQAMQEGSTP